MTSEEPPYEPARAEVPVWVPFVALAAVLFLISIFGLGVFAVISLTDPSIDATDDLPVGAVQALTFVQDAVFVFVAYIAVKLSLGAAPRERFGLVRPQGGFLSVVGWMAVAYVIFWVAALVLSEIFGTPDDQTLVTDLRDEDSLAVVIGWAVLICFLAPIVEEFFFRGFMFTVLQRRMGVVWAVIVDGVVFGLGHASGAELIQVLALAAFGMGLCLLYWQTQSIIPCMALHALNNSITFGVTKDLEKEPALFVGVVVLSVGAVVGAGMAVAARRPAVAA
jgi:membrane protease YdiL (CAAX protease family)